MILILTRRVEHHKLTVSGSLALVVGSVERLSQLLHQGTERSAACLIQVTESLFDIQKHVLCLAQCMPGKLGMALLELFAGVVDQSECDINVSFDKIQADAIERRMVV